MPGKFNLEHEYHDAELRYALLPKRCNITQRTMWFEYYYSMRDAVKLVGSERDADLVAEQEELDALNKIHYHRLGRISVSITEFIMLKLSGKVS